MPAPFAIDPFFTTANQPNIVCKRKQYPLYTSNKDYYCLQDSLQKQYKQIFIYNRHKFNIKI